MKEFKTARKEAKAAAEGEELSPVEFKLDGREMTAHPPKSISYLMLAASADSKNMADQALEMVRFVENCLDKPDRDHISARLKDPDDDFDLDELVSLFEYIVEKMTGRPTESSPA